MVGIAATQGGHNEPVVQGTDMIARSVRAEESTTTPEARDFQTDAGSSPHGGQEAVPRAWAWNDSALVIAESGDRGGGGVHGGWCAGGVCFSPASDILYRNTPISTLVRHRGAPYGKISRFFNSQP